jgi:hypothetical protein
MAGNFAVVERPLNRDVMNYLMMMSSERDRAVQQKSDQQRIDIANKSLGLDEKRLSAQISQFDKQLEMDNKRLSMEERRFKQLGPLYEAQAEQAKVGAEQSRLQLETWKGLSDKERQSMILSESVLEQARAQMYAQQSTIKLLEAQMESVSKSAALQQQSLGQIMSASKDSPEALAMISQAMLSGNVNFQQLTESIAPMLRQAEERKQKGEVEKFKAETEVRSQAGAQAQAAETADAAALNLAKNPDAFMSPQDHLNYVMALAAGQKLGRDFILQTKDKNLITIPGVRPANDKLKFAPLSGGTSTQSLDATINAIKGK